MPVGAAAAGLRDEHDVRRGAEPADREVAGRVADRRADRERAVPRPGLDGAALDRVARAVEQPAVDGAAGVEGCADPGDAVAVDRHRCRAGEARRRRRGCATTPRRATTGRARGGSRRGSRPGAARGTGSGRRARSTGSAPVARSVRRGRPGPAPVHPRRRRGSHRPGRSRCRCRSSSRRPRPRTGCRPAGTGCRRCRSGGTRSRTRDRRARRRPRRSRSGASRPRRSSRCRCRSGTASPLDDRLPGAVDLPPCGDAAGSPRRRGRRRAACR